MINGKRVPGGTLVSANMWLVGRTKRVFGGDEDIFRPERWLEADAAQRAEMRRAAELLFGAGRWLCSGKLIAYMELNKFFVEARFSYPGPLTGQGLTLLDSSFATSTSSSPTRCGRGTRKAMAFTSTMTCGFLFHGGRISKRSRLSDMDGQLRCNEFGDITSLYFASVPK